MITSRKQSKDWLTVIAVFIAFSLCAICDTDLRHLSDLTRSLYTLSGHYYPLFYWKDSTLFVWFYEWWPYAITHGLNIFQTNYLYYPKTLNLTHLTSIPTLAAVMAPVTIVFGPVLSYNLVQVITPAVNAMSAYLLLRKTKSSVAGAVVGGYVFGFSSYVFGQLPLHPHLSFVALIPLGVLLYIMWYKEEIKEIWFVLAGAVLVVAQAGISLEILLDSAVAAVVALLVFRESISARVVRGLVLVGIVSAVLLAPFLAYFFNSSLRIVPIMRSSGINLLYTMLPLPYARFFWHGVNAKSLDIPEQTLLIGPFLASLLFFYRKQVHRKIWAIFWIFLLISIGTPLVIGSVNTGIINPFGYIHYLPLMRHAVVSRFSLFVWMVISVAIAQIISHARWRGALLTLVALISLLPNPSWGSWVGLRSSIFQGEYAPVVPSLFLNKNESGTLLGKNYIMVPYYALGQLWQAVSDMKFRGNGAYATANLPDLGPLNNPDSPLWGPIVNHGKWVVNEVWASHLTSYCQAHNLQGILFAKGPWAPDDIVPVLRAAGWHETRFGSVLVLDTPKK